MWVWYTSSGQTLWDLGRDCYDATFSLDGRLLATKSYKGGGFVRIWETYSGQEKLILKGEGIGKHGLRFLARWPLLGVF